jgi:exopolysaccharide biosynthesis polyprenyl glycosylphosphotransferase
VTVEIGNVQLEVEASGAVAAPSPRERAISPHARRALHNGQFLIVATTAAAAVSTFAFERSPARAAVQTALFALSWLVGTYVVTRSLRTVRAVVGTFGLAVSSGVAGLAIAGAGSFWLEAALPQRIELLTMSLLVLGVILGIESVRERLVELRSQVLVVGGGKPTQDLLEVLTREPRRAFRVVGVIDETTFETINGVPVLGRIPSLGPIVREHSPDLVVVAADRGRPEIFAELAEAADAGFRVVGLPEFYEHAFARVPIRGMTDAWFMSILHLYQRSYPHRIKRAFDLLVAAFGLLLTAPLFPLIALLVRLDGGPVFYRQTRIGEHGKPFEILKFRSMRTDAEQEGAVWAARGDSRVTALGRVLRRARLDELPQLFNVIRGEMSIVGPRPERPEFLEMLEHAVPFWSRRNLLRPGITGWAQLRSGYASDSYATEDKLEHDLWYLRHQSLIVDLMICFRTIPALLLGVGL